MNKFAIFLLLIGGGQAMSADRMERELERGFAETIHPFLQTYCFSCHGEEKQKGKFDLRPYSNRDTVAKNYRQWEVVLHKLKSAEMPPEEARHQPSPELRQRVIAWIRAVRQHEAKRHAGDPGLILPHRLSNAEYNYTLRDLTGVDLKPAREFPVDPANEAGFDNSGESLAMSPALLNKYLEATRQIAEHLVLKPDGFVFASHPMITESDRDKYCVQRIIDFYQRHSTNYADYFMAAWRYQHRAALGHPRLSLAECAAGDHLSSKYLATTWSMLTGAPERIGPLAVVQEKWRALPVPHGDQPDLARPACEKMRDLVLALRQRFKPDVTNLVVRGIAAGSQPLVLWKDRQYAANRRRYDPDAGTFPSNSMPGATIDSLLAVPEGTVARAQYEAAVDRFCRIFPDAFYVSERVLVFLKEDTESRGRLLSAGFHLMTGYFRDDAPLSELLLDAPARGELDKLWEEFHFITLDSVRQYKDFIFFERAEPPRFMQGAEFDFARSEDRDATSAAKIRQLAAAYVAKARRQGGAPGAIEAIEDYFNSISADIRRVEQARLAAEPKQLEALLAFAQRAFRRPLTGPERVDLLAFYGALREKDGLDHEEAIRDTVASVLMSPHFCYRGLADKPDGRTVSPVTGKAEALSDNALASRLSYFLWSSMPDAELLASARSGTLHRPGVLLKQMRRMLQDERVRGLVTEFGGNWLDFRRFEEHNAVDRERFKTFNNELREAMFAEPIQFFLDLVQRNRSVLDFLYADHTFVNASLAAHYGIPFPGPATGAPQAGGTRAPFASNEWVRVERVGRYGRGGLLPMSVFLTMNAPGLRTSPVKRGYWVVRRLLGEQIPPPPPNVPELPADERKLGELTVRDLLARHRDDPSCAGCHARFDAIGLAFEGYGPIGEQREKDLGDRLVDARALFPGGQQGTGMEGLRRYLRDVREHEFLDNFCRKLLAYALGRSLLLSDDGLIDEMQARLATQNYRFGSLVETIVTSPQFLMRRDPSDLTKR